MKSKSLYFLRDIDLHLKTWKEDIHHKPLLLRGARQVGKSSAVRHLGETFEYFLEVNFERNPDMKQLFSASLSPKEICSKLSAVYNLPIQPDKTLVFFDEIQACLPAIASLRFFYEEYSELHVIAAGSLLEFALQEIPSFGVGRIRSLYMYPFSFNEFLQAQGLNGLIDEKRRATIDHPLLEPFHKKLTDLLRTFLLVGGMPESVKTWIEKSDYLACRYVQNDIIETYIDDFAKYKKRISPMTLQQTLRSVALQSGCKFVYSQVSHDMESAKIKEALDLLSMAGIIMPVTHTAANGVPLGAEVNTKFRKYLFMDTGLLQRLLNLDMDNILLSSDINLVNKGTLTEVLVGLELLKYGSCYERQELYYWLRLDKGAQAEVDYVLSKSDAIIPIEVKAGTKGSMQSLYSFMALKKTGLGIRTSMENFGRIGTIDIYPLYAIENFSFIKHTA
ncbi:MAG: ATP-binding protein [Bacteroidales bacterium]|nr:ATP-binding protein [Bacteroidales bacterium]